MERQWKIALGILAAFLVPVVFWLVGAVILFITKKIKPV